MFFKILVIVIIVLIIPFMAISTLGFFNFNEVKNNIIDTNTESQKANSESQLANLTNDRALYYETYLSSFYNLTLSYKNFIIDIFESPGKYGNVTSYSNDVNLSNLGISDYAVSGYHIPPGVVVNSTIQKVLDNMAKMDLIWVPTARNNHYVAWTYFGSKYGVYQLYHHHDINASYDPRVRPWYINAITNNPSHEVKISEPYIDAFGLGLMVTFAVPVYINNNTEYIGVMAIDVTINTIVESIFKPLLYKSGYQFIVNSTGGIIARLNLNETNDPRWDETFLTENLIATSNEQFNSLMKNKIIVSDNGFSKIRFQEGGIKYVAYKQIPVISWTYVVVVSESDVLQNVIENANSMNRSFDNFVLVFGIIILMSILFSIIIGYLFSKNITRPLIALSKASDQIAIGDYNLSLDIKGEDELGRLGQAFLSMNESLKSSKETLEIQKKILILLLEAKGLVSIGRDEEATQAIEKSLSLSRKNNYSLLVSIATTELDTLNKHIADSSDEDIHVFESKELKSYMETISKAINELD